MELTTPWKWFDKQGMLASLGQLSDEDLEQWANTNREKLTIGFLSWIAEELNETQDEVERNRLSELGGKLVAIREGFSPAATSKLTDVASTIPTIAAPELESGIEASLKSSGKTGSLLKDLTGKTSPISLSVEGMRLLEQQAAALEVSLGATKAQALTEILGRKSANPSDNSIAYGLMAAHTASRILEVLIQMESREERCAMLPNAFIPPDQGQESGTSEDEDALCTTPWQLLQAIDLWLKRSRQEALEIECVDPEKVVETLKELREDLLGYLDFANTDDF
jgi:hypothetical protein